MSKSYKGENWSRRIWQNTSKLVGITEQKITDIAILGKDVRKASRELQRLMGVGYNQSKRLCVTETSRVYNEGCRQRASERGYKTYHVLVEPDACDECKKLKGKHFRMDESILPVHPFCKCSLIIDLPEI